MLNPDKKRKIENYIKGNPDSSEKDFVESLFTDDSNNKAFVEMLKDDWDKFTTPEKNPGTDLMPVLDKIHHIINKEKSNMHTWVKKTINTYMQIAAIMLIPLFLTALMFYVRNTRSENNLTSTNEQTAVTEIFAPYSSRVSFNLPDGTKGMLNSGSKLSYSLPFSNNRRIILEGEAWFEVTHDEEHPFTINSGSSSVVVLGTSFNISAYPTENYVEIVLSEGKVEFSDSSLSRKVVIKPLQRLVYKDGNIEGTIVDPEKYNSWTKGKLVFRGDPMAEIARRIERWYNVKVVLADKELENYSFRATFEDDSLEDVFRYLSMTTPIKYRISPGQFMSDSTYSKETVTVYLNK
jgi:transmembrane sensor